VLFNNAGISPSDDASVLETSYEAWQRVQDVNLSRSSSAASTASPTCWRTGAGGR
jgi:NAD(P)-dependent dehydrogenase (short-subunit alcohol dehydrogenase family)